MDAETRRSSLGPPDFPSACPIYVVNNFRPHALRLGISALNDFLLLTRCTARYDDEVAQGPTIGVHEPNQEWLEKLFDFARGDMQCDLSVCTSSLAVRQHLSKLPGFTSKLFTALIRITYRPRGFDEWWQNAMTALQTYNLDDDLQTHLILDCTALPESLLDGLATYYQRHLVNLRPQPCTSWTCPHCLSVLQGPTLPSI